MFHFNYSIKYLLSAYYMSARYHGNTIESRSGTLIPPTPISWGKIQIRKLKVTLQNTKKCKDEGSQGQHGIPRSTDSRFRELEDDFPQKELSDFWPEGRIGSSRYRAM